MLRLGKVAISHVMGSVFCLSPSTGVLEGRPFRSTRELLTFLTRRVFIYKGRGRVVSWAWSMTATSQASTVRGPLRSNPQPRHIKQNVSSHGQIASCGQETAPRTTGLNRIPEEYGNLLALSEAEDSVFHCLTERQPPFSQQLRVTASPYDTQLLLPSLPSSPPFSSSSPGRGSRWGFQPSLASTSPQD